MSEQISIELLKVMNDIAENENTIAKIDASLFLRESEKKINEKVAYLYNMIKVEAKNCNQKQDLYFDEVNLIITHYKQKLNMVYDEFYCQYVNIQNELQEANINRRIAMINYQKLVNNSEKRNSKENILFEKQELKRKNEDYKKIVQMCNSEFVNSKEYFEKMINEEFLVVSNSLQIISEQNIFQKMIGKIANIFQGRKRYTEILKDYNRTINKIDSQMCVEKMRNNTVEFVANILEIRGINENGFQENVRIGGKNGRKC